MNRFRRWYGQGPLQLLLLVASFALALYAGVRLLSGNWPAVAAWFVGAALVHDLLFVPLYACADRALAAVAGRAGRRHSSINFVRVPAFLSLLLLLVWFPLVTGQVKGYESATGLSGDVFLARWLLISAALFAGSALWLAVRVSRGRRSATKGRPSTTH